MIEDLDTVLERMIATCSCDACDRYRRSLAALTFKLERSMRSKRS